MCLRVSIDGWLATWLLHWIARLLRIGGYYYGVPEVRMQFSAVVQWMLSCLVPRQECLVRCQRCQSSYVRAGMHLHKMPRLLRYALSIQSQLLSSNPCMKVHEFGSVGMNTSFPMFLLTVDASRERETKHFPRAVLRSPLPISPVLCHSSLTHTPFPST